MAYFRKCLSESVVNDCNKRFVRAGLNLIRASETKDHDQDNSQGGGDSFCDAEMKMSLKTTIDCQGLLLIDATCTFVDIRCQTDLSWLNEVREVNDFFNDSMYLNILKSSPFANISRTYCKQPRLQFLSVAIFRFCSVDCFRRVLFGGLSAAIFIMLTCFIWCFQEYQGP